MIIIPKLSILEEQMLNIIASYETPVLQLEQFRELFPYQVSEEIRDLFGKKDADKMYHPNIVRNLNSLQDQEFIHGFDGSVSLYEYAYPIMLTAIGRGYLENNNILIALLDQALLKLSLPESDKKELRTSTMNQIKESGQEFLVKLIAEGLARISGL